MPLEKNWLTTNPIDYEFKFYKIKAYQQECLKDFESHKIYPSLTEATENYQYTSQYINNKSAIELLKTSIIKIDLPNVKLIKKSQIEHDVLLKIDEIAKMSLPILNDIVSFGKNVYDEVLKSISAEKISDGIDFRNGYALYEGNEFQVYEYHTKVGINNYLVMELRDSIRKNDSNLVEIKNELNKKYTKTIWNFSWKKSFPFVETVFPISKSIILKDSSKFLRLN